MIRLRALALAIALLGNGYGAASFLWQGAVLPHHVFFAAAFGYSVRWALDEATKDPSTGGSEPRPPFHSQ